MPDAITVLLAGWRRVEVSPHEAERALDWASRLERWADAETKPPRVNSLQA